MKHRDRERTGEHTFRSDSFTLYSRSELDELVAILKGRLYKEILPDSLVLWGYRMDIKEISREHIIYNKEDKLYLSSSPSFSRND